MNHDMTSDRSISLTDRLPSRRTFGVALVVLAMVLAGCGGGGGGGGGGGEGSATTASGGETTAASEETAASSEGGATTTTGSSDGGSGGAMTNGSMDNGSMAGGSMSNGSMDNGSMAGGSMSNGSMDNGSMGMSGNGTAAVRVAHMSPDAPAVDVYLDNESAFEGVEYTDVSDYLTVPTGEHVVTITAADNRSAEVFNNSVNVGNAVYTVGATGEISENASQAFAPLVLEDQTQAPTDAAAVRVAHVAPTAGPVDVTVEDSNMTLVDGASFGNATQYAQVPGGDYTLEVRADAQNNSGPIVDTFDVSVDNGTSYTAYATGYANESNAPEGVDDAPALDLVTTTDGQATSLRVAHMSPDAPAVDVYVDNESAFEGVEFGDITDYADITSSEHVVTITEAGNRSAEVFNGTVPFEPGAYTVTATGEVSENGTQPFEPVVLSDNTSAGENTSLVRVVHASPDAGPVDVTVEDSNMTLVDGAQFGAATDYLEVPGGDYTLEVRADAQNNSGPIVDTFDVSVENGTSYTAFAAGYVDTENATGDEEFDLIVTTDGEGSVQSAGQLAAPGQLTAVQAQAQADYAAVAE